MALNRVGKEKQIGFMNIDYDKLSQEVDDIKEAHNKKTVAQPALKRQTSGDLHRQQAQNKILFLEGESVLEPEKKAETKVDAKPAQKLDNDFGKNPHLTDKSIFSASYEGIKDTGGPSKQMQVPTSNTIWDNDVLQRMANNQELTSREKTQQDKGEIQDNRRSMQQERMDALAEGLQNTELRNASNVSKSGTHEGSNYNISKSVMSIFDTEKNFERLPEKTTGESISEKRQAEKDQKDNSWRGGSGQLSSKDVTNRLFDALVNKDEE